MFELFLSKVVSSVLSEYPNQDAHTIYITPGKRAAIFLKKYYAEQKNQATVAPEFISIDEFVQRVSGLQKLPNLSLIFELYEVYQRKSKGVPDDFETFVSWGQTLLQDFNEIDQYLIPPEKIFPYVKAIKEVEHWSGADKLTEMQEKHLAFWDTLGTYYEAFQEKLLTQKQAYSGLMYRVTSENILLYIQKNKHKVHIFAGFNALSKSEELIIQHVLEELPSEIYWDIDKVFLEAEEHDAGLFVKSYFKNWQYYRNRTPKWIEEEYQKDKDIRITGVPKSINQAHKIASIVKELPPEKLENTAVVLANENLLLPTLQSLQTELPLNITMGYPLQQTPLSDVFTAFFRLYFASSNWYYKDVLNLLMQPHLRLLLREELVSSIIEKIKERNLSYLTKKKLRELWDDDKLEWSEEDQSQLDIFFLDKDKINVSNLIDNCFLLIYRLREKAESDEPSNALLLEQLYRFYLLFNQLKQKQEKYGFIQTPKALFHIYLDLLSKETLDFRGEPLQGLQLMGVLESRNLDFETVIISSLNEGVLPAGKMPNSFIPFDVKMYLGLPTYKQRDAIFTYHFYRLLQRAKNIHILYDTENDNLKGGEKSRFVLQLLATSEPNHKITHQIIAPEVYPISIRSTRIEKDENLLKRLQELAERGFSPSALTNYIRNPLIFYQQNVLGVREERDVEETVEARTFGDIVHGTLEDLYRPFLNEILTVEHLKAMRPKITEFINKHFEEKYQSEEYQVGKNVLVHHVIREYIERFLRIEEDILKSGTEIIVEALETELKIPITIEGLNFPIYLKGMVDRIDRRDGVLHIIDYKTGKVDSNSVGIYDWDLLIQDIKYGKAFQLLMYAYMYQRSTNKNEIAVAGNYSFKNLSAGLITFHVKEKKRGKNKDYEITDSILKEFENQLKILISELFNPSIDFEEKEV